jgi:uncharacterized protein with ParB-like and HNH nuclease domain
MEAEAKSITFLSNEGVIRIPFFQRSYVWKKDNWEDLLNDLYTDEKNNFLGSLILKQQKTKSGEAKEALVIDGQQRLTTLSILLKALYDSFPPDKQKNCEVSIRNHLFYKQYQTDSDYLVKIAHSQVDSEAFQNVIRYQIEDSSINIPATTKNKIYSCYNYFMNALKSKDVQSKLVLFNRLLHHDNKIIVVIDLSQDEDEQAIFDTINSAGVRLSCADIIKNALFQKIISVYKDIPKVSKLYKDTWEKVFLTDDETIKFWETQRITGRLMRDNIEILLHSIAVIKGFYDPDKHTLSDLSKLYKEQIKNFNTEKELEEFTKEIKSYGEIYKNRMLVFDESTLFEFSDSIERVFHILEVLQISTFHPFILYLFFKYDDSELKKYLRTLELFIMRRMLGGKETKSYNKLCKDFIDNPGLLTSKLSETTDAEVSNGLQEISNKNANVVLFWIELYRRSLSNKYDTKELKYVYTLEHIMPQKWEEYWTDIPDKINIDGSKMSLEEAKKDRYEKIYWIGNMTLLTSSLNTSLRNYTFEKKVIGDGRKKGIKAYADLSITKDDIISKFDSGDLVWDEKKIIQRTQELNSEVLAIWS